MTNEHRLSFELCKSSRLESEALCSIEEKLSISKRSHEYIRRIMVQGLVLTKILKTVSREVPEIQKAVANKPISLDKVEFKFRLNIEAPIGNVSQLTPEEEIWSIVSKISRRDQRKKYLRDLFLNGYWFETLAYRDKSIINQLLGSESGSDEWVEDETPVMSKPHTAKNKLGGLMPQ